MWMHVWIGVDAAIAAKSKKDVIATPTVLSASGGNVAKRMMGFSLSLSPGPYDRFASSLDRRRTDVERSAHVWWTRNTAVCRDICVKHLRAARTPLWPCSWSIPAYCLVEDHRQDHCCSWGGATANALMTPDSPSILPEVDVGVSEGMLTNTAQVELALTARGLKAPREVALNLFSVAVESVEFVGMRRLVSWYLGMGVALEVRHLSLLHRRHDVLENVPRHRQLDGELLAPR